MGYGRLYKPLWGHTGLLKETIVSYVSKDGVIIGSPMIYSGVMQFGAKRGQFGATKRGSPIPWGSIPARRWLGLSPMDERKIVEEVDEYLATSLENRGF